MKVLFVVYDNIISVNNNFATPV